MHSNDTYDVLPWILCAWKSSILTCDLKAQMVQSMSELTKSAMSTVLNILQ